MNRAEIRKSDWVSMLLLIRVKTTESAITGRNSSIRSRASEGRPWRPVW